MGINPKISQFTLNLITPLLWVCIGINVAACNSPETERSAPLAGLSGPDEQFLEAVPSNLSETEKIDFLLEKGRELLPNNLDSALKLACMASDLVPKNGVSLQSLRSTGLLSECYLLKGDFKKSKEYARQTLSFSQILNDEMGLYRGLKTLREVHYHLGEQDSINLKDQALNKLINSTSNDRLKAEGFYFFAHWEPVPIEALRYHNKAIQFFLSLGDSTMAKEVQNHKAYAYYEQGDYSQALTIWSTQMREFQRENDLTGRGLIYENLGLVYRKRGEYEKAIESFSESLKIQRQLENNVLIANSLQNIGTSHMLLGNMELAENFLLEGLNLFKSINYTAGICYCYRDLSGTYMQLGNREKGLAYLDSNLSVCGSDPSSLIRAGQTYIELGRLDNAIKLCMQGLKLVQAQGRMEIERNACQCLYTAFEKLNQPTKALNYYKQYNALSDNLFGRKAEQRIASIELEASFQAERDSMQNAEIKNQLIADREISKKNNQRNVVGGGLLLLLLFSGGLFFRYRLLNNKNKVITLEKQRSDDLLLNILPHQTAEELKATGKAKAQRFEEVTVLFADISGFTKTSSQLSPEKLVEELNYCFSTFDKILSKYKVEKIKTVGDAYICVGGLPTPYEASAFETLRVAKDMQAFMLAYQNDRCSAGKPYFEIRIGIHTGPVVAGIVGIKKFAYDIWGDTVNIAARMEQNCEVGKINVSAAAKNAVQRFNAPGNDRLEFESRGKIEVKGKGEMEMFYLI